VTEHAYQRERALRLLVKEGGLQEDARVLADFYEHDGQLSRAKLWRDTRRVGGRATHAADLIVRDFKWRRKVMMWLVGHVEGYATVARAFKSSPSWTGALIHEVERKICETANAERHHPTMAATLRLQAARALPRRFERGIFKLGEPPPESWPATVSQASRIRRVTADEADVEAALLAVRQAPR
jgi:hypothetical protein